MHTVFVQVRRANALDLVFARSAFQSLDPATGDRFMVLESGYRYEGKPGTAQFVVHKFEKHGVRVRKREETQAYRSLEVLSLGELLEGNTFTHFAELQWRISVPISVVVLGLLAVPLARTSPRQGKYGKLFVAVLIYFIYTNMMSIGQKAVERGDLNPLVGVWPAHLAMLLIVGVMVFVMSGGAARMRHRMRHRKGVAR
jgi:lipopolysaccharide export system permease protein